MPWPSQNYTYYLQDKLIMIKLSIKWKIFLKKR